MKQVEFKYIQIIETIYPGYNITVPFFIGARVHKNEEVEVLSVKDEHGFILAIPNQATSDGRNFLALMREAARNEAYRLSKQAIPNR